MSTARRLLTLPAGRRAKWLFVLGWLVLAAVAGPFAGKLGSVEKNDASSYLPRNAESTQVSNTLETFPRGRQIPGVVVYEAGGRVTAADRQRVQQQRQAVLDRVADADADPVQASADGHALSFAFRVAQPDATLLEKDIKAVRGIVDGGPGMTAYVAGAAGLLVDSVSAFEGIDSFLLLVTGGVVIVLLLLIYRSPTLWVVPILSVGMAITLSQAAVYALAKYAGLVVSGQSAGILTVLVFGAGTDYALLLVARYREELHLHDDRHEAMAAALQRAAPAILASAATVVLGLLCLLVAELNSDRGLGPVGAIGVTMALLAQVTLLPALLVVGGRWLFWPARPRPDGTGHERHARWARIARGVAARPRRVWVGTTLALALAALGLLDLNLGLRQTEAFVGTPESVAGQQVYAAHFPAGGGAPTIVVADAGATQEVLRTASAVPGVATAVPVAQADGRVQVAAVLRYAPDSPQAYDTVRALRTQLHALPGAGALVGGPTATDYDVRQAAVRDRTLVMPIVLVVVLVILGLLLRAVVAPVLLVGTVVLSFAASLGLSALVFDAVGFAGMDESLPLLAFVFLVALGIDYNIFLMSRVHEEAARRGTREGTIVGVTVTGGVITSAGVVLAATFSALTVLPLVALVELGSIVAFGVLLDTLVVRSLLVPALTIDLDRRIWWPSRLSRSAPAP